MSKPMYRYERRFPPALGPLIGTKAGRYTLVTGATSKRDHAKRSRLIDKLFDQGRLDVMKALKERRIHLAQLVIEDRDNIPLGTCWDELNAEPVILAPVDEPLWQAVDRFVDPGARLSGTRKRYRVSLKYLRESGAVPATATVGDLRTVNWKRLAESWTHSNAHWNHVRRAVSAFLTVQMGDVYDRVRRDVVKAIPIKPETERVPDITPEVFWRIVRAAPEYMQAPLVLLAATGLRVGEYMRCQEHHLKPNTRSLEVPGTKTALSAATLKIDERLWAWVELAIPAPLAYKAFRIKWKQALKAAGVDPTLRLHDLRHCTGQWLVDAGRPESSVQQTLRHSTPAMTRRYTRMKDRGEDAKVMADVLFPEPPQDSIPATENTAPDPVLEGVS